MSMTQSVSYVFFFFSHLISGQYADLVTRVTNFQNDDKGLMVLAGDVFDVPIRKDIIQRVVRWQLAKRQQVRYYMIEVDLSAVA